MRRCRNAKECLHLAHAVSLSVYATCTMMIESEMVHIKEETKQELKEMLIRGEKERNAFSTSQQVLLGLGQVESRKVRVWLGGAASSNVSVAPGVAGDLCTQVISSSIAIHFASRSRSSSIALAKRRYASY